MHNVEFLADYNKFIIVHANLKAYVYTCNWVMNNVFVSVKSSCSVSPGTPQKR